MNACPSPRGTNAQGFARNGNWFLENYFNAALKQFSDENVNSIVNLRRAPTVMSND